MTSPNLRAYVQGSRPVTPTAGSRPQSTRDSGSRPQTPASSAAYSHHSYSAFSDSSSTKLPPIHLSTIGRRELLLWINDVLDLGLTDISQVRSWGMRRDAHTNS